MFLHMYVGFFTAFLYMEFRLEFGFAFSDIL
jgi:hypothetical protein